MIKLRFAMAVLALLSLAASVWAQGAGGTPPAEAPPPSPQTAALAALTQAFEAVSKGDAATLGKCLAPQLLGVLIDPNTGVPRPLVLQSQAILQAMDQGAVQMDILGGRKLVDMTAQVGPGDVVLVTYSLGTPGIVVHFGEENTPNAMPKPLGPFWALVGKLDGQWRVIAFTIPMSPPA